MNATQSDSANRRRALDALLVVAAQQGDRRALEALVRRWHPRLIAHGWRLIGNRALAEESVQAAWIDILRGLPGLRDEAAFPAWAYRIVTRKAGAGIGGMVAQRHLAAAYESSPEIDPEGPDAAAELGDLRRAVAALPPGHRAAVALHYFEGLSVAEVAISLGVPVGTIKTRLMHARAKLRTYLQGEDHD
jgi:RNA polymerase sigma-70 factor (ECF subfamily)